jgi:ribonuclease HII
MIGIDEVGRGSWVGPLLVCAVRIKKNIKGLKDSKTISPKKREILAKEINRYCDVGYGWVSASEIDDIGLSEALRQASAKALLEINLELDEEIIIDGTVNFLPDLKAKMLIKADQEIPEVSAASIIAKVTRDKYMKNISKDYPGYCFEKNVGYGTKEHTKAIEQFGLTNIHRKSYKLPTQKIPKNTTKTDRQAENAACNYLISKKFKIIDQNLRNRYCEIDIIAQKHKVVYFVEVKFRANNNWCDGLEAISPKKLKQMEFAANFWIDTNKFGGDYRMMAISVQGNSLKIESVVEI